MSLDDIKRERHRRSFYSFFVDFWPLLEPAAPYLEATHTRVLCDHLQAVFEGRIPKLSIEIGPGYGKSLIACVAFPAWIWACRDAGYRLGFSTYKEDLTVRDSGKFKALIQSDEYQALYGHRFQLLKRRDDWQTNNKGGHRVSMSTQGGALGYRYNLWIGDDLLNYNDSLTEAGRKPYQDHLVAISTRGQVGRPYYKVIIGQRLGEGDPGSYARENGYQVLCLPTEFDPSRKCQTRTADGKVFFEDWRTERGELLFPTGFGPEKVAEAKFELRLNNNYSAQHQQLPIPADGGVIKAEYLHTYTPESAPQFSHNYISVDTAQGQAAKNDKYGVCVHGVHEEGISLIDGWTGQERPGPFIARLKQLASKHQPSCVIIEQKDWGKALAQMLEDDPEWYWRIERYTPVVSKDLRAHEASPFFFKGRYSMPAGSPLSEQAAAQLVVFPAAKARDLADSIIQAVIYAQANLPFGTGGFSYESSSTHKKPEPSHRSFDYTEDDVDDYDDPYQ